MNIFQVLSRGRSKLHEPSMSAMLGYLLDSHKDHGLGDAFIRKFIEHQKTSALKGILDSEFIDSRVSLEEPYQLDGSRKDIDIQIDILGPTESEAHRIIIENKIKVSAANPRQLNDYYKAILEDENDIRNLHIIFLTPNSGAQQLKDEYEKLDLMAGTSHSKCWIFWTDSDEGKGITSIIASVLEQEAKASINPINEYMRHTLKAFIKYSTSVLEPRSTMRTGEDIGEIVEEEIIKLEDGTQYRVVRRDSGQIQVFNLDSGDKEYARNILSKYVDEKKLSIGIDPIANNTRTIGKRFFDWKNGRG
jgi:hypothetical protein